MPSWLETDWAGIFQLKMSLPEILIRGTLVYLSLVLMLRVILKRQAGKVSLSDLLVVTLVAGICRNPLVRDAYSIPDGLMVVATVLLWSYALDWLSYQVPFIHQLLHPSPIPLIRDGTVLEENLRHELITKTQLESKLRIEGVNDPRKVAEAWMEGNGHVSVIRKEDAFPEPAPPQPREGTGQTESSPSLAAIVSPASRATAPQPAEIAGRMNGRHQGPGFESGAAGIAPVAAQEAQTFLEAAEKLQEKVAWHRMQVAEHQQAIAQVKELLGQHGVRLRSSERRG